MIVHPGNNFHDSSDAYRAVALVKLALDCRSSMSVGIDCDDLDTEVICRRRDPRFVCRLRSFAASHASNSTPDMRSRSLSLTPWTQASNSTLGTIGNDDTEPPGMWAKFRHGVDICRSQRATERPLSTGSNGYLGC